MAIVLHCQIEFSGLQDRKIHNRTLLLAKNHNLAGILLAEKKKSHLLDAEDLPVGKKKYMYKENITKDARVTVWPVAYRSSRPRRNKKAAGVPLVV